jgi:hypothetical protein
MSSAKARYLSNIESNRKRNQANKEWIHNMKETMTGYIGDQRKSPYLRGLIQADMDRHQDRETEKQQIAEGRKKSRSRSRGGTKSRRLGRRLTAKR